MSSIHEVGIERDGEICNEDKENEVINLKNRKDERPIFESWCFKKKKIHLHSSSSF